MKFTPCAGSCDSTGTHCDGCGRSHEEIRQTLALVTQVAEFMDTWGYQDPEAFLQVLNTKAMKKLARIQAKRQA